MTTSLTCCNYIDGQWLSPTETIESRNPTNNNEVIATFPRSDSADVDVAVASARKAYRSWRLVPAPARAEYIFRVGELLLQHKEELAQLISREMGKAITEARGDVQEGVDIAFNRII